MKFFRILLLGLTALVSACDGPAFFSSSLSDAGDFPTDESVLGDWYAKDSNNSTFLLHVLPLKDGRLGVLFTYADTGRTSVEKFRKKAVSYHMIAHPSEVNGDRYYNIEIISAANLEKFATPEELEEFSGFMIYKAKVIDDDWLVTYMIAEDTPQRLAGWSESNSRRLPEKSPRYDVSRDELRKLVSSAETDKLLKPFFIFRRLREMPKESYPPEILSDPRWKL